MKISSCIIIIFFSILMVFLSCKKKDTPTSTCKICCTVTESNNVVIDSAKIEIKGSKQAIAQYKYTQSNGAVCIDNLEPDSYHFIISKKGYSTVQQDIVVANEQQQQNFIINKIIALFGKDTVSNITGSSAMAKSYITDLGYWGYVTQHGHCWSSTSTNPTIYDNTTTLGTLNNPGQFVSPITGLSPNTMYYVRAYATNSAGIVYNETVSFITTSTNLPTISTSSISNITQTTVTCGGNVSNDGGYAITSKGVCWNTATNPTISNSHTTDGSGVGSFSSNLTGLNINTIYFLRAYASNSAGTAYGNEVTVTIFMNQSGPQLTDYDGNTYSSVKIGTQVWMQENLKVTHYRNGTSIPLVTNNNTWNTLTSGAYCNYNNSSSNVATYGQLYNYYAAVDTRNLCPSGWHVPSDNDLVILKMFLGMSQTDASSMGLSGTDEGGKLKETGTVHWLSPNQGATNTTGFTALPGGERSPNDGLSYSLNTWGLWWTTTPDDPTLSWCYALQNDKSKIWRTILDLKYGLSVRCLKD